MLFYTPNSSPPQSYQSKSGEIEKQSRVLLVCVYDTIVFEISNDLVYEKFHEFGSVLRILIFDRREVTKLFIEFSTNEEATKAREVLDGKKLYNNICKMSIYFSTFDNVDLKHQTSEGLETYYNYGERSADGYSINSELTSSMDHTINLMDDIDEFSAFGISNIHRLDSLNTYQSFLPRSKTDNNEISWHIKQVNKESPPKKNNIWDNPYDIDQTISSNIDSILNCEDQSPSKWSTNSQTAESPKTKSKSKAFPSCGQSVVGFEMKYALKHSQVWNLFSNFGNVSMILVKKCSVRVKYRTAEFAAIAMNYLNNTWLFSNKLELVLLPSESCFPEEGENSELICYDFSSDREIFAEIRFTEKKSITINPPSKTLHISGLKKEKCTLNEIKLMFQHIVEPNGVKILKQGGDKNMALIQYDSLEDSFDIVAECHGMIVGGRKVQISFTKSQI